MKHFRYALLGTVFLFFFLFSCSSGEETLENSEKNQEVTVDDDDEEEDEKSEEPEDSEEEEEDPDDTEIPDPSPQAAVFLDCKTVSGNEIVFEFSQPVKIVRLQFIPEAEIVSVGEGVTVEVTLAENLEPGLWVTVDLSAEDEHGNTISEEVLFQSKNTRVPALQINELRTEYSKPKAEFVEFKVLSAGNLGALRVFAAGNIKKPLIYEFASIEVEEGEYVVLHLRTLDDSCKDEYGDSLDESGGTDSSPTARDFWIPGSTKLLRKTDAVYVLDQDDKVLDAVMIAEKPGSQWNKSIGEAAEFLFNKDAWASGTGTVCTPAEAVNSSGIGTALTRSVSRDETAENTRTAADWFVTATSGETTGQPNSTRP
jgi:hypothetical protein